MVNTVDFETPDLAQRVEKLAAAEIHALPFGAVHLDGEGKILFFNEAEARLSGYCNRKNPVGNHFFTEVAPCLATPAFLGRIERARAAGSVDIEFGAVGDFDDLDKELRFRIQSASDGGIWIFTLRL